MSSEHEMGCGSLPAVVSTFIDTFVDFSVSGGIFLPLNPNPNPQTLTATITHSPSPSHRLVAIGDLHGDIEKSKQAFKLARLVDHNDNWVAGDTTVVQVATVNFTQIKKS